MALENMVKEYFVMGDFGFKGKRVLLRIDGQADLKNGVAQESERMRAHISKTLVPLLKEGAKVAILVHQGKDPKDDKYCELEEHAKILSRLAGREIGYVHDLTGGIAVNAIKGLKEGQAILLRNVRNPDNIKEETAKLSAEEHSRSCIVKTLQPLFDYFVLDAYSIAHRSQASVVGFTGMPNIAGNVMVSEIEGIDRATRHAKKPYIAVLGGAKADDYIDFMKEAANRISKFCCAGLLGELMLMAKGYELGAKMGFFREKKPELLELVPVLKELLDSYPTKFLIPTDVAIERDGQRVEVGVKKLPVSEMIYDIGEKTALKYAGAVSRAKTIYMKGPAGKFEDERFGEGSRILVEAIAAAKANGAYTFCGGGETTQVVNKFASPEALGFVSLSGGALIETLAGKELPGIIALKESYERFRG